MKRCCTSYMGFVARFSVLLSACLIGAAQTPQSGALHFGLIGDQQYTAEQERLFPQVIDSLNRHELAFVVHDGDILGADQPCSDAMFERRVKLFKTLRHPFLFTPGDNDWTDCHRSSQGGFDPLERLGKLRELFYPAPGFYLGGGELAVRSQSDTEGFEPYRENLMWTLGPAVFATVHAVGSNNNKKVTAEFEPRNRANLAWIEAAFARAQRDGLAGVMLIMQADPHFEKGVLPPGSGFAEMMELLLAKTKGFAGQVVLVHGDSHYFRIDKPLPVDNEEKLANFTRVETFGPENLHWVQGTVVPGSPNVFQFQPMIVHLRR